MSNIPQPPISLSNHPTPITRLTRLSERYECDLYVKRDDMTAGIEQGNKIRKLEYLLADAKEHGADAVITTGGLQSNHCRATAVAARQLGMKPYLLLRGTEPDTFDGNLLLDEIVGAEIEYVTHEEYYSGIDEKFQQATETLEDEGYTPYIIPSGGSNPIGTLAYINVFEEIESFLDRNPSVAFDSIYVATGSGGTQAGLIAGACLYDSETEIVGVRVSKGSEEELTAIITENVLGAADRISGFSPTDADIADRIQFVDYLGPGYAEPSEADLQMLREAGRTEGLVLDTCYTVKGFRAAVEQTKQDETTLFIHTGGSYGLFPHRDKLTSLLS